ncbi:MAG: SRPBCC family protein [Rhodococcus sp. (in: high G+C Gram-positive bacteria)]
MTSRHLGVVIQAAPKAVYEYMADVDNLTSWAGGLASGFTRDGEDLLADSPMGTVRVRFTLRNELGVLDHDVTLPDGTVVHNPLRVLAHPDGAEVLFTVRQLSMTDEEFARDCAAVERDLNVVKSVLEAR